MGKDPDDNLACFPIRVNYGPHDSPKSLTVRDLFHYTKEKVTRPWWIGHMEQLKSGHTNPDAPKK